MRFLLQKSSFVILLSLLSVVGIIAQTANCPELVNEALLAVDEACSSTGRNEACYGYNQVEASFLTNVAEDFFAAPADLAAVADIETIRTAPLNTETGTWGVALMNIQADLPNTIPGQSVTFILLGDVEVENAVSEAFVPSDGIEIEIDSPDGANVRSGPGTSFNVVGGLRDGETVMADGLSEDGEWLRIAYRERPAWLSMSVINDNDPALRDLPTLTADLQTPMQAFYLRTGIGEPECEEAPNDSLLVQGPENIEITINVNGASIRLGSTGSLRIVEGEDGEQYLEISVYDGEFEVGDVVIRRGQRSIICLGDENSRGLDGENNDLVVSCDPSNPEPFDLGEWCNLEEIPAALLNYPLDVPCPGETPPPTTGGTQTTGGGATDSQIPTVDCSGFSIISPLSPVDAGNHTFSWTAVTGENITYQLVFYNYEPVEVESFFTSETSYTLNLGAETSTGGTFYWEVRAYQNGAYACVSFRSPAIARTADADVAPVGAGFTVSATCYHSFASGSQMKSEVTWSGLAAGETISATLSNAYGTDSDSSNASSGTMNLANNVTGALPTTITVTTSDGHNYSTSC